MIERQFDIAFIADLALREKQIQQNYRPVIAVHKWFARRPGTLFRGLLLSEFATRPLKQAFYQPNAFEGIQIADPFMGGGIPLIEANRLGCNIVGYDINPMSYWIVKEEIDLSCSDATGKKLPPASVDGVFTDPPYFGNVQYAELMDFCYVWLRKLTGKDLAVFKKPSTRNANELTANVNMGRNIEDFTKGLSHVFQQMARALKPGSPLVFTYHHNAITAYYPVGVAILDSGLVCSASLPCPAEMGASIHINGTGSSIIDTIFVCRSTGKFPRRWLVENAEELVLIIEEDIEKLRLANVRLTYGDLRCIIFGHLTRLAIWNLRNHWDDGIQADEKIKRVADWVDAFGGLVAVEEHLKPMLSEIPRSRKMAIHEPEPIYEGPDSQISF